MTPLALVKHVVKFDFQALLSFDRLHARITSTKSRRFIQLAASEFPLRVVNSPRIAAVSEYTCAHQKVHMP